MGKKGWMIAVLAVLAGCATQREPEPATPAPADTPPQAEVPPPPEPQAAAVERLRGSYSTAQGWTLCGESTARP